MSDAFVAINRGWRHTCVNRAAQQMSGLSREEMLLRCLFGNFHATRHKFESALRRAMNEGATVHFEEYYAPLDTWFQDKVYPSGGGVAVYARNPTGRKPLEEALRDKGRFVCNNLNLT